MSLDPYQIVKSVLVHANRFSGSESMLLQRPPAYLGDPFYYPVHAIERDLAVAAFNIDGLHAEYQRIVAELSMPPFTIALRREINTLPKIIRARLSKWGWDYVLGPGGLGRIRDRLETHQKIKRDALLDAARSWREGENIEPHPGADRFADEAIRLGIKPPLSPEQGEREFYPRYDEWYVSSALGDKLPHVTPEEHGQLGQAIDRLAGLFGREDSPERLREYAELNRQAQEPTTEPANPVLRPKVKSDSEAHERTPIQVALPRRNRGGRPADTDIVEDRRIAEAWKTGQYGSLEDLANAFGKRKPDVRKSLDRHRKRASRDAKIKPRNSGLER